MRKTRDVESVLKQIDQALRSLQYFGVIDLPVDDKQDTQKTQQSANLLGGNSKQSQLNALHQRYGNCQACALGQTRKNFVFGQGDADAQLMFVGEAPGYDEDIQGQPFVGAAGQLLTKIIEAMKLKRERVYIANCLKCRPPQNRNPLPDELSCCQPILKKQIEIIQPKVICTLGKFASQSLLNSQEPISRLRGTFVSYEGIAVMPTFHPAYLLRNPADKKLAWSDMQQIMRLLGI